MPFSSAHSAGLQGVIARNRCSLQVQLIGLSMSSPSHGDGSASGGGGTSNAKVEKLVKEYQKYKQQVSILKKGILEEQKKSAAVSAERDALKRTLQEKEEELETLTFNNNRLQKRLETVQADLTEAEKKRKESQGFSIGNLIAGRGNMKEQVEFLEKELNVLRDELQAKIEENEQVHIQLFEMKRDHAESKQKQRVQMEEMQTFVEEAGTEAERRIEQYTAQLKSNEKQCTDLKKQLDLALGRHATATEQLKESEAEVRSVRQELTAKYDGIRYLLRQHAPFIDTLANGLNVLNLKPTKPIDAEQERSLWGKTLTNLQGVNRDLQAHVAAVVDSLKTMEHLPDLYDIGERKLSSSLLSTSDDAVSHLSECSYVSKDEPSLSLFMEQLNGTPSQAKGMGERFLFTLKSWIAHLGSGDAHDSQGAKSTRSSAPTIQLVLRCGSEWLQTLMESVKIECLLWLAVVTSASSPVFSAVQKMGQELTGLESLISMDAMVKYISLIPTIDAHSQIVAVADDVTAVPIDLGAFTTRINDRLRDLKESVEALVKHISGLRRDDCAVLAASEASRRGRDRVVETLVRLAASLKAFVANGTEWKAFVDRSELPAKVARAAGGVFYVHVPMSFDEVLTTVVANAPSQGTSPSMSRSASSLLPDVMETGDDMAIHIFKGQVPYVLDHFESSKAMAYNGSGFQRVSSSGSLSSGGPTGHSAAPSVSGDTGASGLGDEGPLQSPASVSLAVGAETISRLMQRARQHRERVAAWSHAAISADEANDIQRKRMIDMLRRCRTEIRRLMEANETLLEEKKDLLASASPASGMLDVPSKPAHFKTVDNAGSQSPPTLMDQLLDISMDDRSRRSSTSDVTTPQLKPAVVKAVTSQSSLDDGEGLSHPAEPSKTIKVVDDGSDTDETRKAPMNERGYRVSVANRATGESRSRVEYVDKEVERQTKQYYETKIHLLMGQLRVADEKAVDDQIQWQHTLAELDRVLLENQDLCMELAQVKELSTHTEEELRTTKQNYESQIKILSEHICSLENSSKNKSGDAKPAGNAKK